MRQIRIVLALLLALIAVPAGRAHAQSGTPSVMTAAPAAAAPAGVTQGPPRTLRAYWHLFAAFAIVWLLVFGYVFSLARRFRRVEEQLDTLRA